EVGARAASGEVDRSGGTGWELGSDHLWRTRRRACKRRTRWFAILQDARHAPDAGSGFRRGRRHAGWEWRGHSELRPVATAIWGRLVGSEGRDRRERHQAHGDWRNAVV